MAKGIEKHLRIGRADHSGVVDSGVKALVGEEFCGDEAALRHLADPQQTHVTISVAKKTSAKTFSHQAVEFNGGSLRESDRTRTINVEGGGQHHGHFFRRRRGKDGHVGDGETECHVENPMMARSVITGDSCTIENQRHVESVESNVVVGLVERPGKKR